jgi:hypothetical protein
MSFSHSLPRTSPGDFRSGPPDEPPTVAVRTALGDNACVTHDNTYGPLSPPPAELLDLLRRIADHDDAPDTVQADARDYLQYLEAASFGFRPVKGEACETVTADLQNVREVVGKLPRPRCGTA